MTEATGPGASIPPRYFWRRVGAVVVDYVLVVAISTLMLQPFLGNSDKVRLDAIGMLASDCVAMISAPPSLLAVVAPKTIDSGWICTTRVNGRNNGTTAVLIYDVTRTEHTSSQRSISVPTDMQGNPVAPLMPQSLINEALLIVVGGMLLRRFGRTPGKRLFGLRVVGSMPVPGIRREGLKTIPGLIAGVGLVAIAVIGPGAYVWMAQLPILPFVGGILAVIVVAFWFYALPLIRWRGATRYDRMLGLTVTRG